MPRVLIADDDVHFAQMLGRVVEKEGHEAILAFDFECAIEALDQDAPDILLADLELADRDGLELIALAQKTSRKTQGILMSGIATAQDYRRALKVGAVDVLTKPFEQSELVESIGRAMDSRDSFAGPVHGLALVEMLQAFHFSGRPVSLHVSGSVQGRIHLEDGEIVGADCEDLVGEPALAKLLSANSGTLRTEKLEDIERTIGRRFETVILDAFRQQDEDRRDADQKKDDGDAEMAFDFDLDALGSSDSEEPAVVQEPSEASESTADESDAYYDALALNENGSTLQELGDDIDAAWELAMNGGSNAPKTAVDEIESHLELDELCRKTVSNTDGAVACGVVDLDTGMTLGIYSNEDAWSEIDAFVSAACMDMFRGPNLRRVQELSGEPHEAEHPRALAVDEMTFTSPSNQHFAKTINGGKAVIMLITNRTTSACMGWSNLVSKLSEIEPLLP